MSHYAYARTIIGYHGCDAAVAEELLQGAPFRLSENDYDWLGKGVYFWEFGPDRALRFAQIQKARDEKKSPAHRAPVIKPTVVGAVLQLGTCFDLLDTEKTAVLQDWYGLWRNNVRVQGEKLPENEGKAPYFLRRFRDCAVLNSYLEHAAEHGRKYDTVRGCFLEGKRIFPRSGIFRQAHIRLLYAIKKIAF